MKEEIKCEKCSKELKTGYYLGDFLAGIVDGYKPWASIDLCEECHTDIVLIIKNWWDN